MKFSLSDLKWRKSGDKRCVMVHMAREIVFSETIDDLIWCVDFYNLR